MKWRWRFVNIFPSTVVTGLTQEKQTLTHILTMEGFEPRSQVWGSQYHTLLWPHSLHNFFLYIHDKGVSLGRSYQQLASLSICLSVCMSVWSVHLSVVFTQLVWNRFCFLVFVTGTRQVGRCHAGIVSYCAGDGICVCVCVCVCIYIYIYTRTRCLPYVMVSRQEGEFPIEGRGVR
jgi:hypothetical protein